jgi:hypothetical protein
MSTIPHVVIKTWNETDQYGNSCFKCEENDLLQAVHSFRTDLTFCSSGRYQRKHYSCKNESFYGDRVVLMLHPLSRIELSGQSRESEKASFIALKLLQMMCNRLNQNAEIPGAPVSVEMQGVDSAGEYYTIGNSLTSETGLIERVFARFSPDLGDEIRVYMGRGKRFDALPEVFKKMGIPQYRIGNVPSIIRQAGGYSELLDKACLRIFSSFQPGEREWMPHETKKSPYRYVKHSLPGGRLDLYVCPSWNTAEDAIAKSTMAVRVLCNELYTRGIISDTEAVLDIKFKGLGEERVESYQIKWSGEFRGSAFGGELAGPIEIWYDVDLGRYQVTLGLSDSPILFKAMEELGIPPYSIYTHSAAIQKPSSPRATNQCEVDMSDSELDTVCLSRTPFQALLECLSMVQG